MAGQNEVKCVFPVHGWRKVQKVVGRLLQKDSATQIGVLQYTKTMSGSAPVMAKTTDHFCGHTYFSCHADASRCRVSVLAAGHKYVSQQQTGPLRQ